MGVEVAVMSGLDELSREELIALVQELHSAKLELTEQVAELAKEVAALRSQLPGGGAGVPEWVKPNRSERRTADRAERKRRKQSFVRKRDIPTREATMRWKIARTVAGSSRAVGLFRSDRQSRSRRLPLR